MIIDFAKSLFRKKTPASKLKEQLAFKHNTRGLTIGVESELQIVNKATLQPVSLADELAKQFGNEANVRPEALLSTFEVVTGIHHDAHAVERELAALFSRAAGLADGMHAAIIACSCHPTIHYNHLEVRKDERYAKLAMQYQWLYRQWIANGMHIHIGMVNERECMRFMNFFRYFIPHFVALSASSPFIQGEDTGLVSSRAALNEAMPIAPLMHAVTTWEGLRQLVFSLEKVGTIATYKDLWWDVRPSPSYGTLELRAFDMPSNLFEQKAIVAFVHALALWFEANGDWLAHMPAPDHWIARENKWRAMRYGTDATIIRDADGVATSLRDDMEAWLGRIAPITQRMMYQREMDTLRAMLENNSAAHRMKACYDYTKSMQAVIGHVAQEFRTAAPVAVPGSVKPDNAKPPVIEAA